MAQAIIFTRPELDLLVDLLSARLAAHRPLSREREQVTRTILAKARRARAEAPREVETVDLPGIKIGPFTITPNIDPYNGRPLPGFRIHGRCSHLSPGASMTHLRESDAIAWCKQHVERYHAPEAAQS